MKLKSNNYVILHLFFWDKLNVPFANYSHFFVLLIISIILHVKRNNAPVRLRLIN